MSIHNRHDVYKCICMYVCIVCGVGSVFGKGSFRSLDNDDYRMTVQFYQQLDTPVLLLE